MGIIDGGAAETAWLVCRDMGDQCACARRRRAGDKICSPQLINRAIYDLGGAGSLVATRLRLAVL